MSFIEGPDTSTFLKFTAQEFRKRGTRHRRELSDKTNVHRLLEEKTLAGRQIGLPEQYAVLSSPGEITAEVLGDRAALKFAHGWSAKGVMLLERIDEERYFDHMALREWTIDGIRAKQQAVAASFPRKKPAWIVEELLRGAQPGPVPFDYKFYMFQGEIGMVAQIDRNSSPPRVVKLDGDLKPLIEGRDYRLKPKDLQPGVPLVPRSAVMLSRWAIELSTMTDSPFVRVDLYDTVDGPYFGEFTFSSGAEFKRTITYSKEMLDGFDSFFAEAERRLRGDAIEPSTSWSALLRAQSPEALKQYPMVSIEEYERFSYFLHNRGRLGGARLAEAYQRFLADGADPSISRHVGEAHKAAARQAGLTRTRQRTTLYKAARKVYRQLAERPIGDSLPPWRKSSESRQTEQ